MTPQPTLKIIQHNVRHWHNNRFTLANIYNHIDPDIILINDHSITDNNTPLKIFNYNVHTCNKDNTIHSGAAIAIKRHIPYKLHDNFHTDMLAITIDSQQGPITIGTTYIPPRTGYINYIDFHTLFNRSHPVYLLADLNARHTTLGNSSSNHVGKQIHSLITRHKCTHIGPYFPTLITHNSTTSPDIVLTNNKAFHNIHLQPGPITPSDHIPIIATISANPIQIPIRPRRSFYRANWTQYKQTLSQHTVPTQTDPTLEEIDTHLDNWTKHIQDATDTSIPTITHRIIPGIKPTHETLLIQTQYQATLQHIHTHGPSLALNRQLITLRQQLQTVYRHIQTQTWQDLINALETQTDPKKFWSSLKRMLGSNTKQTIPYLKHNNIQHDTPEQKEPIFRKHWQDIFTQNDTDNEDFDIEHIHTIQDQVSNNIHLTFPYNTGDLTRLHPVDFPPITIKELQRTLKTFKQKAPGPTGITTLQLKHLPKNMIHYLLYIFNHSISAGYFPDSLKHAIMIFLPKPNTSQHQVQNYRPISLLDIHGKLLDKILNNRLYEHLSIHNIHNTRQHGFRKHRGTNTALATFHETLAIHLAQRHTTDIVLRDVTKAFDKVWHTGLQYKIIQLNLHSSFTKTLSDYLTDRTASIRIGNHIGPPLQLHTGVPQGACLSPTLYSFYTHDLPPPLPNTDYIAFADDITQITTGRYKHNYAAQQTQHAIQQINTFENKWLIRTNTTKFKIIPINRQKTSDIFLDNTHYPYTNNGKVLGLKFTTHGFRSQVTIRKAIALTNLHKIHRFYHLPPNIKRTLYLTLVRSALIYPPIPLHTLSRTAISHLQKVQNKALKFITNTHWSDFISSQTLHEQCNIPTINTVLHQHARKTWSTIKTYDPLLFNQLTFPPDAIARQHRLFQSSKIPALGPPPPPLYK